MGNDSLNLALRKKFLLWGSAVAFVAALVLYLLCLDPNASLWDCPEYITSARRLEIGHPPGNPTWMLIANFATLFVTEPTRVALVVNLLSALSMALAVALLFQTIFLLLESTVFKKRNFSSMAGNAVSSLCGSLVFAWSDSTIFSAIEAEVYALSMLSTAFMVWLMLKWAVAFRRGENRTNYLILLGYVGGLSFGVHELSLLTLTTLALIYVFAINRRPSAGKAWLAVLLSFVAIGFILIVCLPMVAYTAGMADVAAANHLGLGINSGAVIFLCLFYLVLLCLPFLCSRLKLYKASTLCWIFFFFMLGCATYHIIPIRASANPPMNQADPSNPLAFYSYLTREQYGSKPLFYGRTPYSSILKVEEIDSTGHASYTKFYREKTKPRYAPYVQGAHVLNRTGLLTPSDSLENEKVIGRGEGYIKYGYRYNHANEPELNMWFPRITESSPAALQDYKAWADMDENTMDYVEVSAAVDSLGRYVGKFPDGDTSKARLKEKKYRPTYMQQLRYLLTYQIGYMYVRYFMWNFSGRQNNMPSTGEIDHGNFITGIPPLDSFMLGATDTLPPDLGSDNRGYNRYFMLPLLFGLLGALGIRHFGQRGRRATTLVLSLFLMTGLAIVFYLNQNPSEARERDYAFLGSFYAFCIWIGFGAAIIINFALYLAATRRVVARKWLRRSVKIASLAVCLGLPALVLSQTYDDHNRSGRDSAADVAVNMLNSLEPDAILIVEGDNRFFPLIYAQEVLGVRRDVTVMVQSYLPTTWYPAQFLRQGEEARPVEMTAREGDILFDAFSYVKIGYGYDTVPAVDALKALYKFEESGATPVLETKNIWIRTGNDSIALDLNAVNDSKVNLMNAQLAVIDILATNGVSANPRPIYWQNDISPTFYKHLEPYTVPSLYARKWVGRVSEGELAAADLQAYRTFMELFGSGQHQNNYYSEPYVSANLSFLRKDAVNLAMRLMDNGEYGKAKEVIVTALSVWPYSLIPPDRMRADGVRVEELDVISGALESLSRALPEDLEVKTLLSEVRTLSADRREAYRKYYYSLPRWRRNAVSYQTRSAAAVDSI